MRLVGWLVGWLVCWLIVQAKRSESPRLREVVPSRTGNTPCCPVSEVALGIKTSRHITDRGSPGAEASTGILQKVRPTGAHPPTADKDVVINAVNQSRFKTQVSQCLKKAFPLRAKHIVKHMIGPSAFFETVHRPCKPAVTAVLAPDISSR